jgi:hypothetical protein
MSKVHIISKIIFIVGVINTVCFVLNIFISKADTAGLGVFANIADSLIPVVYFVSPVIVILQIISSIVYGVLSRRSIDYTIRTEFYQMFVITVFNIVLMCIPGNNFIY